MTIIIWIIVLLVSFLYFFRENFISELAISFVPYIIWFCILSLFLEIYLILKESRRKRKNKKKKIFLTIIISITTIWIWTLYTSEFLWFYNQNDEWIRIENKEWIKVFYANILYKNTNYLTLQEKIVKENPDIVILVEFSDEHEGEMKEFFKKNYPYMNRNSRSTMLAWDVVFSKIPLENITESHLVSAWSWNYSYINIQCKDTIENCEIWVDLYVIHTAAPVSLKNFEMRNSQLNKLKSDLSKNQVPSKPTIIIWDFNLSPRSYYYKQFTNNLDMLNALSFQSPNYTRSLRQQWIFRSHIDQLFISKKIKVSNISIENLEWSDHRSFTFNFWIN